MVSICFVDSGVQDQDAASKTAGVILGRTNAAGGESGPCKQKTGGDVLGMHTEIPHLTRKIRASTRDRCSHDTTPPANSPARAREASLQFLRLCCTHKPSAIGVQAKQARTLCPLTPPIGAQHALRCPRRSTPAPRPTPSSWPPYSPRSPQLHRL
jgi:hypothetical protein